MGVRRKKRLRRGRIKPSVQLVLSPRLLRKAKVEKQKQITNRKLLAIMMYPQERE